MFTDAHLHDAFLTAIGLEDDSLRLSFKNGTVESEVKIDRVSGLYVNNFLKGNIVFSAQVYSLPIDKEIIEENIDIIEKYCEYYKNPSDASSVGRILFITSSYGAELMAVFDGDLFQSGH